MVRIPVIVHPSARITCRVSKRSLSAPTADRAGVCRPVLIDGDGAHMIGITSDGTERGERRSRSVLRIKVDTTPPVSRASPGWNCHLACGDIFVDRVGCDFRVVGYMVNADGVASQSVGTTHPGSCRADGNHVLEVRAVDAAGNGATAPHAIRVDTNVFSLSGPIRHPFVRLGRFSESQWPCSSHASARGGRPSTIPAQDMGMVAARFPSDSLTDPTWFDPVASYVVRANTVSSPWSSDDEIDTTSSSRTHDVVPHDGSEGWPPTTEVFESCILEGHDTVFARTT